MDARGPTYTTGYTTSSPTLLTCLVPAQAKNSIARSKSALCPTFLLSPMWYSGSANCRMRGTRMAAPSALAPHAHKPKLLAPVWHTLVLILFVLVTGYFQSRNQIENHKDIHRVVLYSFMICFEWFLFAYVWFLGIRPAGVRLSEVIGGRWVN